MPDKLEEAVLSGALFADPSLSLDTLSEYRPPSPSDTSPINTDDELGSDLSDYEPPSDSITSRPYTKSATPAAGASSQQSTRTGPKGVLQDSQNAKAEARTEQMLRAKEGREGMERRALLGSTWKEEEAMRDIEDRLKRGEIVDEDDEAKRRWKEKRVRELNGGGSKGEGGKRRGHLREVGMEGYLRAVEDDGWTVVLIYEPSLPSLPNLISALQSLAASHPPPSHNFLLAKASSLSFMLQRSGEPDLDVLPTMLVYGPAEELVETWVRVDMMLQGGKGVGELLLERGVITSLSGRRDDGDDDDDYYGDSD